MIISGLIFIHSNNIVFGDMKPRNFVFDEFNNLKFADFGDARLKKEVSTKHKSYFSPYYLAPELY